jgi:tripartite ATP-independent transporter DctM subunit
VGALFLAGAIPGIMIGCALMATVYGFAKVYNYPIEMKPTLSSTFKAFKGAALAMLTPVFVIFGIVAGVVTPTESAIVAAAYSLFLGMVVYRTVTPREVGTILYDTGRFASISLFAIGTASVFGWLLAYYNVPRLIIGVMTDMELSSFGTALVIAFLFLFFGLFIDAIPTIIILGTVLLPVATQADISPIVFAMIGIISLAFGLVTPPYGLCLLISASIGGMNVTSVLKQVAIILLPMLFILLLVIIFPEISLWLPKTLMPNSFK